MKSKFQATAVARKPGPTSAVPVCNRRRNCVVSGDGVIPIVNLTGIDMGGAQFREEQKPRAGAASAIDKSNTTAGQAAYPANALWISAADNQSVLSPCQIDEHNVFFGQEMFDERNIIFPGLGVEQMDAGNIRLMLG